MKVEAIPEAVQQAMYQLRTGRPRPVELEIPSDLLISTADVALLEPLPMPDNHIDADQIRAATELLANASHPLIWAGGGVITGNASKELTRLAESLNSPVITTPEGKGAISGDHPLCLGVISAGPSAAIQTLPKSDVILVVGSRFTTGRARWKPLPNQKLIRIDIDPAEITRHPEVHLGINADSRLALLSLLEELPDSTKSVWQIPDLVSIREMTFHQTEKVAPLQVAIFRTINNQLQGKGILVPDVTNLGYWCHPLCPVSSPQSYVTSSYFGTLGYAFPTALGAKFGNPERTVVALCGDGGFLYAASDLATAVKERLNLIVLVFVDNAYGTCMREQKNQFEGRTFASELHNPDFARLAESFGAKGIRLSSHEELWAGLQAAMSESRPTVIEIPVPNMVVPWEV
jgi:acetolactate synthase-1/2/3 large subunit